MSLIESRACAHGMSESEKDRVAAMVLALATEVHRIATEGQPTIRRQDEPCDLWLPPEDVELLRRSK